MNKPLRWLAPILLLTGSALQAATLEAVREHGALRCGVNGSIPGLSHRSEGGVWSGLDVDFCRAVAAAVLGDAGKVEFTPLSTKDRLNALAQGKIDLLARNTTWTLHRELSHGVDFVGINYYDGQAFMVPREAGLHSALELGGAALCTLADSTSVRHAEQYFRLNRMKLRHDLWKRKYPDVQEVHGIPWTGIENASPEIKALAKPPAALKNLPFDPLEYIEHLDQITFDPDLDPGLDW